VVTGLALLVVAVLTGPGEAWGASLVVDTLNDDTTAGDGLCTLREAIMAANADADFQDCTGSGLYGDDTITFSVTGTIALDSLLPPITDADGLTIDGAGETVTISGGDAVGVLRVNAGAVLTIQNLTIADGAGAADCGTPCGGAIFNILGGTLNVVSTVFTSNGADDGGAIMNSGRLDVTDSTFSGNRAETSGGAISTTGLTTVTGTTFSENRAGGSGGGILVNGARLEVTASTFDRNVAEATSGGGILNLGGTLIVTTSTFTGNEALIGGGLISTNGGALELTASTFIGNEAEASGGGVFTDGDSAAIANSTFFDNSADEGGGLVNNSPLTVTNSTFAGNSATTGGAIVDGVFNTTTLRNTIVATSTSGGNCAGTITDGGGNLDDGTTCGFSDPTSQSSANAGLDPAGPQNTGGPTRTIALVTGSDGIDRGVNAVCAAAPVNNVDQRGAARPFDGDGDATATCDVGAFEFGSEVPGVPVALNHFLCYKTKASKGDLCAGGAPNAGAACETEEDCGGEEGVTALCVANKFPKGVQAVLTDQFDADVLFDVQKPAGLCTPADKDGEDSTAPADPEHLQSFPIKEAKDEPEHAKRTNLLLQNQFGDLRLDTVKPSRLLVPTAKSAAGPVPEPTPGIDHFKCYTVKVTPRTPKFEKRAVAVVDQFGQPKTYDVVKPTLLCTPVDKNGEAPGAETHADHLVCYQAGPAPDEPKHVKVSGLHLSNQFGPGRVDTIKEEELCVPSRKVLLP
jgi:CSLREA domain-containing protein